MRLLIQRVKSASVEVEGEIVGEIRKGLLVFLGVKDSDDGSEIPRLAKKLVGLRIFEDDNDKMNLSVKDIQGEILLVSQFTLYADCSKGNRPGFSAAAPAKKALEFYEKFISELRKLGFDPQTGIFQAKMQVYLQNDGPVTMIIEK
jgi:D-tyrosyl-tRNA(Tyr) deacylase